MKGSDYPVVNFIFLVAFRFFEVHESLHSDRERKTKKKRNRKITMKINANADMAKATEGSSTGVRFHSWSGKGKVLPFVLS